MVEIIWVSGSIVSYFAFRGWWKMSMDWTVKDRIVAIILSIIFTWFGVIASLLSFLIEYKWDGGDKPAKW